MLFHENLFILVIAEFSSHQVGQYLPVFNFYIGQIIVPIMFNASNFTILFTNYFLSDQPTFLIGEGQSLLQQHSIQ